MRILIIDGSLKNRTELTSLLSRLAADRRIDMEVFQAVNVPVGMEHLTHDAPIDIVMADASTTGVSAEDLLLHLRGGGRMSLPVFLITSRSIMERVEALRLGASGYLARPLATVEEVEKLIAPFLPEAV